MVPRTGRAGRPVLAEAQTVVVRDVYRGVGSVSLDRDALDSLLLEQGVRTVRPQDSGADHRGGRLVWVADSAVVECVQVFQSAGEVGKSETRPHVCFDRP